MTKKGEPYNPMTIISLFEGRPGSTSTTVEQPPSLVERIVKEQIRLMALGKSKADAMAAAINEVCATDSDITIKPKASSMLILYPL